MIIITNEMLDKAFGDLRVNGEGEIYSWSVQELSKRDIYGKGIKYVILYDGCSDPQKYVDNWMRSNVASMEAAEYYNNVTNMEDDNMNKYETLLKKYGKLCREFEAYKEVTEDIADKGTYVTNEALEELLECKKRYDTLFKEHKAYCYASEDVAVKLIKTEKKYDELKSENNALYNEFKDYRDFATKKYDELDKKNDALKKERDGIKKENDSLYKEFAALKKERDGLVKEVYYLHEVIEKRQEQVKEKMDKIKQRDKQITELIRKNNVLKEERDCLLRKVKEETNVSEKQVAVLIKERDEYAKRLEHINAMSNLEWKFEVVEETETTRTAYDKLVDFCNKRYDSCIDCPNKIACDGINMGLKPAKWNEDEIAEYNELMALCKEDK